MSNQKQQYNLYLSPEVIAKIKIMAAKGDMKPSHLVELAVQRYALTIKQLENKK